MPARGGDPAQLRSVRATWPLRDYREAITYSFVDPEAAEGMFDPQLRAGCADQPDFRGHGGDAYQSAAGLVGAAVHCATPIGSSPRVRLFETGLRFVPGADRACNRCQPWAWWLRVAERGVLGRS